jgi:hypothetical protein
MAQYVTSSPDLMTDTPLRRPGPSKIICVALAAILALAFVVDLLVLANLDPTS